ncbi:hypothetical protein [Bauldia sp.]|uniref:hypothetical protein n=1 Tax=Bauldia sp. TaxID=2575872 RepID=UPI003BA881AE
MQIPFGPWRPDPYLIDSQFSAEAKNVLPSSAGWKPFPALASITDAVGSDVRGAFKARTSDGATAIFCGTATKLFKLNGTTWDEVTRLLGGGPSFENYNLPADNYWSFAQQDNILYAVQAGDVPQFIDVDGGANFAPVAGPPPTARYVKAVGNFLFLLDLTSNLGVASTGRIQAAWSGMRDFDFWTYGEKSSDFATFFSGGHVMGMTSKQTGLLIQESAVNRFQRVNDRRTWVFEKVEAAQGTRSPHSIIEHQGTAYYYGTDGFVASSPGAFTNEAGVEWVDEWFKENVNIARIKTVIGALDPTRPRFFWLFPSAGNDSYVLDRIIGFDPPTQQWFHADLDASFVFDAATTATTLEGLGSAPFNYTLETMPISLDSDIWKGGAPRLGGFTSDQKLGFFTGSALAATLRTGSVQLVPGRRAFVNGFRPTTDALNVHGRAAVAERSQDSVLWGSQSSLTAEGLIPMRASGRYHQFECSIPANELWNDIRNIGLTADDLKQHGTQ